MSTTDKHGLQVLTTSCRTDDSDVRLPDDFGAAGAFDEYGWYERLGLMSHDLESGTMAGV